MLQIVCNIIQNLNVRCLVTQPRVISNTKPISKKILFSHIFLFSISSDIIGNGNYITKVIEMCVLIKNGMNKCKFAKHFP